MTGVPWCWRTSRTRPAVCASFEVSSYWPMSSKRLWIPANISCASSITHRSNWSDSIKISRPLTLPAASRPIRNTPSPSKAPTSARASIASRLKSWNSSWRHCPSSGFGVISRIRFAPSARSWAMTRPASMVFPRPTSSARMHPPSRNRPSAKITASIWCGLASTRAARCGAA